MCRSWKRADHLMAGFPFLLWPLGHSVLPLGLECVPKETHFAPHGSITLHCLLLCIIKLQKKLCSFCSWNMYSLAVIKSLNSPSDLDSAQAPLIPKVFILTLFYIFYWFYSSLITGCNDVSKAAKNKSIYYSARYVLIWQTIILATKSLI